MWTREGLPHDGFQGLASFLTNANVQAACVQEVFAPVEAALPSGQPFVYDGPTGTGGRDAGYLVLDSVVDSGRWSPIPDVPDSRDASWRLLSHGPGIVPTAVCSIYAPHVGLDEATRSAFWSRLNSSLSAVRASAPEADIIILGDSNLWWPGLVEGRNPRASDLPCIAYVSLMLHDHGLTLASPHGHTTHRAGAALDLVFASPGLVHSVETHNGTSTGCSCQDRSACCPLLVSDHFAVSVTLAKSVIHASPKPQVKWPRVKDWAALLRSCRHELSSWSSLLSSCLPELLSLSSPMRRASLDILYAELCTIIWSFAGPARMQGVPKQPSWWNDACYDALVARNAAWRRRRRHPCPETEQEFRTARNSFHRVVRREKKLIGPHGCMTPAVHSLERLLGASGHVFAVLARYQSTWQICQHNQKAQTALC